MDENPWETTGEDENRGPRRVEERDVEVAGVWEARPADADDNAEDGPFRETFVQLRDRRGRELPIFIGPFEAMSIVHALGGEATERPLAHDLLRNLVEKLGARIDRIVIDDVFQGTFYARILLEDAGGKSLELDARPSDAIALGLRAGVPIRVAESVLAEAGHTRPNESSENDD